MAALAAVFDRLGRHEVAATITSFRTQPAHRARNPEINIAESPTSDVLGDQTYEQLARKGETMTTAEMVAYAYDQIDQAQAVEAVSKMTTFEGLETTVLDQHPMTPGVLALTAGEMIPPEPALRRGYGEEIPSPGTPLSS